MKELVGTKTKALGNIFRKKMEAKNFKSKLKQNPVSLIVFLATVIVVLLSLTSVVFPALILRTLGGFDDNVIIIDPFESGSLAYPFLITNFVFLGLGLLYFKNKLPRTIRKSIRFIFNYEISSKLAFFVITIIIGTYIIFSVGELFNGQFFTDYHIRVKHFLEIYDVTKIGEWGAHIMLFLTWSSMQLFGNYKVIPFIASIALLVLTYFFTFEITQKRFAGIVAMVIVLQSRIFLFFDTSVAYPNYWILFYLLSLYLICKKWPLAPISYVLSLLTKILTGIFLPMTLFFIYRANIVKRKKILLTSYFGIILLLGIVIIFSMNQIPDIAKLPSTEFKLHDFWGGFSTLSSTFRVDSYMLLFLLPLTVGLFIASRKGVLHADSIMFFILTMLLYSPFLGALTYAQNSPYRYVPIIIFFAIGVGVLLSKSAKKQV